MPATWLRPHLPRRKDEERATVFAGVCDLETPTRKEIAGRMGLRPISVSDAVVDLLQEKLILEGEVRSPHRRGRPELILAPNWNRATAIAIYIESRAIKAALVNLSGAVLSETAVALPGDATRTRMEETLAGLVAELVEEVPSGSELLGAALSLVGTVDPVGKRWLSSARWPAARDLDFHALECRFGIPFRLSRALDTELTHHLLTDETVRGRNTLLFHWGFGIGAAYAHQGQVLTSTLGRFGEIGHTRLGGTARRPCQCGATGCLETEAALWALQPGLHARDPAAPASEAQLTEFLVSRQAADWDLVAGATERVRDGLLNLYEILHPDVILLTGPFTAVPAIETRLLQGFERALPTYARGSVALRILRGGFRGSLFAGTHPLFEAWMAQRLIAKS